MLGFGAVSMQRTQATDLGVYGLHFFSKLEESMVTKRKIMCQIAKFACTPPRRVELTMIKRRTVC